jgi:hypothetical protein
VIQHSDSKHNNTRIYLAEAVPVGKRCLTPCAPAAFSRQGLRRPYKPPGRPEALVRHAGDDLEPWVHPDVGGVVGLRKPSPPHSISRTRKKAAPEATAANPCGEWLERAEREHDAASARPARESKEPSQQTLATPDSGALQMGCADCLHQHSHHLCLRHDRWTGHRPAWSEDQ